MKLTLILFALGLKLRWKARFDAAFRKQLLDVDRLIINEELNAVFLDVIINSFWEHRGLVAILSLDKSAHSLPFTWKALFYS